MKPAAKQPFCVGCRKNTETNGKKVSDDTGVVYYQLCRTCST